MGTDRIEHIGKNVGRLTRVGAGQRLLHGVQNPHNILQSAGSKPPGRVDRRWDQRRADLDKPAWISLSRRDHRATTMLPPGGGTIIVKLRGGSWTP